MFNQPILSLLILLITSLGFTQNQAITILKNQRVKIDDNLFIEYTYSGHEHVSYSSEEPFSATVATYQLILTKKDEQITLDFSMDIHKEEKSSPVAWETYRFQLIKGSDSTKALLEFQKQP